MNMSTTYYLYSLDTSILTSTTAYQFGNSIKSLEDKPAAGLKCYPIKNKNRNRSINELKKLVCER